MDIAASLNTESIRQLELLDPLSVSLDDSVREVLDLLRSRRRGSVLVCRNERPIGIFTERDALGLLAAGSELSAPISSAMTSPPVTISGDATIAVAIARMASGGYRRLPVVGADGRVVGLLDVAAIVHWLVEHFPGAVYNLPPASKPVSKQREGP